MKDILITSSVLIVVISLLRLILGKRVSRRLIYATWLLVALRLLVPFQFGQFEYSVTSVSEKLEQESSFVQQAQQSLQQPLNGSDKEELYQQLLQDYLSQNEAFNSPSPTISPEVHTQLQQEAEASSFTLAQLLTVIWVCGIFITAGWFLTTNFLFLRKAEKDANPFHSCSSSIPVRISPSVCTPCLAGLLRPRIYLTPESTTDPQALNHILTHELVHLKHADHIWTWVRCLCLCIYWFNPLVWIAAILSKRDCELACDEAALKALGEDQRIAYGRTLLETVTQSPVRIFQTTTAMSESMRHLKERVIFIVKRPKNILIAAICLVLTAALTTVLVFTGCTPQDDPITPSTSLNNQPTDQTETTGTPLDPTTDLTDPPITQTEHPIALTEPPSAPVPSEAQNIAKVAVDKYLHYKFYGVYCKYESVDEDLSEYLNEAQKEIYSGYQYKITCCRNAQQVRDHIHQCLGDNAVDSYPDDKLFTDNEGNLYLIYPLVQNQFYRHLEVLSQSEEQIIARACRYVENGCFLSEIFTIVSTENGYMITDVEEDHDYQCEVTVIDAGPSYKVYRYGSSFYGYKIFHSDGNVRGNMDTEFYYPVATQISENIVEFAINLMPDFTYRIYWDLQNLTGTLDPYSYVIALTTEKIAYLDGNPENRTLVVCSIFDRDNAQVFEDMGFSAEDMPVTNAAFSETCTELTLTYRNNDGTETTVTLNLSQ